MNIRFIASCLLSLILFSTAQAEIISYTRGPSKDRFFSREELEPLVKSKISKLFNIHEENLQLYSSQNPSPHYLIFFVTPDKEKTITLYAYWIITNSLYSLYCSTKDKPTEFGQKTCAAAMIESFGSSFKNVMK